MSKPFRIAVRKGTAFEAATSRLWEAFERQQRTRLECEIVPMDLDLLHCSLLEEGGLRNGRWDVAHVNTDWLAEAAESGSVVDLAPLIRDAPPEGYPEDWHPSLLRLQTTGNAILGLPFHNGPECLIYRRDLFEDPVEQKTYRKIHNCRLSVPETWEEFLRIARFFQRPEQGLCGTLFARYPDRHNNVFDFAVQVWSRGGEIVSPKGEIELDSKPAADALQFFRTLLKKPTCVRPDCLSLDSIRSGALFASGAAAMMVNWFGFAAQCEVDPASLTRGKIGIAHIPHDLSTPHVSLNVYYTWSIGTGSSFRNLSYDFVRFCVDRSNDVRLPSWGLVGCRRSTWVDPEVRATIPHYSMMESLHACARELPRLTHWHAITGIVDDMIIDAVASDRPVGQILSDAQRRVVAVLLRKIQ